MLRNIQTVQVERLLVFGDIGLQYAVERRPSAVLVVAALAGEGAEAGSAQRAVEYLPIGDAMTGRVSIYSQEYKLLAEIDLRDPIPTWDGLGPHPRFAELLTSFDLPVGCAVDLDTLTPLLLLRSHHPSGSATSLNEVLACTRLRVTGTLFARVARFEADSEVATSPEALLRTAMAAASALHESVGTDFQLFTTLEAGIEIEMKLGLTGQVSPWAIASHIARRIGTTDFPGFIPDVGNEHQRWETRQATYEVTAPAAEVGYIAFISVPSGAYLLKRKRFAEDGLRREESFRSGIDIPAGDFDTFLAEEYPQLSVRRLPSFTRAKFDVNVESARSGHFYGIEIDEVTVSEHGAVLRQVELEYHRSRIHEGLDAALIDGEMERLAVLVERSLDQIGVTSQRTFYSKLSFLRDVVTKA